MRRVVPAIAVASLISLALVAPTFALRVVTTIPISPGVSAVAVNGKTNRIYVANPTDDSLSVIDGVTNSVIATIPVGEQPWAVGINTVTNRIYVVNIGDDTVSVIDGSRNTTMTTLRGLPGVAIAVNSPTNLIYLADFGAGQIHVLNGHSNTVIANVDIPQPNAVTVNTTTNKVYALGLCSCGVFVIDGSTNQLVDPILVPGNPTLFGSIAVDLGTNQLYIPSLVPGGQPQVSVLDAAAGTLLGTISGVGIINGLAALPGIHQVMTTGGFDLQHRTIVVSDTSSFLVWRSLRVGRGPTGIATNSANRLIYVSNTIDGTVSVISRN